MGVLRRILFFLLIWLFMALGLVTASVILYWDAIIAGLLAEIDSLIPPLVTAATEVAVILILLGALFPQRRD